MKIDIFSELEEIYKIQKKRVDILKRMEDSSETSLPEMRENLKLMVDILFKMLDMSELSGQTAERKKWEMLEEIDKEEE